MDKIDLFFLFITYLLRMTLTLLLPSSRSYYDYWFHTCDNFQLRADLSKWIRFLPGMAVCAGLYMLHIMLKLLVGIVQRVPGSSIILFWPRFYWHIMTDLNGRSVYAMLMDPRCTTMRLPRDLPTVSRITRRQFHAKGRYRIQPTASRLGVLSSYQVYGAYAHLGNTGAPNHAVAAVSTAAQSLYFDDPLRISTAYTYFRELAREPPDNALTSLLIFLGIVLINIALVAYGFWAIRRHKQKQPVGAKRAALASSDLTQQSGDDKTQFFDTDGIPFVIDNSATCIICNDRSQFVGNLRAETTSVETSHGSADSDYVGTITIRLTTDVGDTMAYQIPNAIYNPSSPFNILGIPYLGKFFGTTNPIPSYDDDGTFVHSSATRTHFVWDDHGKHERSFTHDNHLLPVLTLESGVGYFHAFCT